MLTQGTQGPIILSTLSSRYFAELLYRKLTFAQIMETFRKPFGDGERYLRIETDSRLEFFGRNVIIVASTVTEDDFAEVCRVGSAVAKYGARRVIYVIPFFGYSTMERAVKPGEIVTAKVLARQLSQLPSGDMRNCFLMLDLHAPGFTHYFEGESLRFELYSEPVLTNAVTELGLKNFMFASADLGRPIWVETFAKRFDTSIAFVRKTRDFTETTTHEVIGDVSGKDVIIYDDMTRSATSLIHAAEAYLKKGATNIYAILSHLALNKPDVIGLLNKSPIEQVIVTNSHPMSERVKHLPNFSVKDVSGIFAEAIVKLL